MQAHDVWAPRQTLHHPDLCGRIALCLRVARQDEVLEGKRLAALHIGAAVNGGKAA
jgi:hypothetical protein